MAEIKVTAHGELISLRLGENVRYCNQTQVRQLIADIMAALDEPLKPDVTTQAYQEFDKRPSLSAIDALWAEKEIPFTTEQKMQAVIRKAKEEKENAEYDISSMIDGPGEIVETPFREIPIGMGEMGVREWYRHYQWLVKEGFIRR